MDRRRSVRRSRKYRRPWFKVCKEYIRNFIAFMFSNVGIIGLVLGYTIAGAFIFQHIEKGRLIPVYNDIERNKNTTVARLWNLTLKLNNEARVGKYEDYKGSIMDELEHFQETLVKLISTTGYDGTGDKYGKKQWSFAGGFLYSLTVITTIGVYWVTYSLLLLLATSLRFYLFTTWQLQYVPRGVEGTPTFPSKKYQL